MAFEKGNTYGGRTPGAVGKVTNKVKKAFTKLLENNLDRLQDDLDKLDAKDRLKIMLELASYTIPKLKSVDMQADINNNEDLLNKLLNIPDENFNKLYD